MKSVFVLLVIMLITSIAMGCKKQDNDVQVSPTFKNGVYTLQGVEGRIGILAPGGFIANQPNKYMWYFWGTKEELSRTPFKVEAVDLNSGEKHQALLEKMGTPNEKYVWEYNYGLGVPNDGADAQLPSGLKLPKPGKWKLNAYLGGEWFGSIIVDVK